MERNKKKSEKNKKKKINIRQHLISLLMIAILAAAGFLLLSPIIFTDTRAIVVDGKNYAFIKAKNMTTEEFNTLLRAKLKERYGKNVEINEKVSLEKAHAAKKNISANVDVVIANLCDDLTVKGECGAIMIDGKMECIVKSVAEAEKILKEVLDSYTPEKTATGEVLGVEFVEDIKAEPYYAENDVVIGIEQAKEKLMQTEEKSYVYIVKQGDSINAIATRFNMDESELLDINPDLNEYNKTMIHIGQEINVKTEVPVHGIYTVMLEKVKETVEPPEEEIENLSQYKTYRKVISEGTSGEKMAAYKVYYENGLEIKREPDPDRDEIIKQAEPKKIEVGTLDDPKEAKAPIGNFDYPIEDDAYFSSGFGNRDYGSGRHYGIDIACPAGTPVHASDGGMVVNAGWNNGGYGNWVVIDHGNDIKTIYGHNSAVLVRAGQMVSKGQVISLVGSTGDSTGNNVHFEIRLDNKPRNQLVMLA
ncbi:MAG: M23 family metallopeptidase [Firmicutes bacterium]|nr:M23 family metallopeptidase [Bacillota bacterium]